MKLRKTEKILLVILKVVFIIFLFPAGVGFMFMFSSFFSSSPLIISDTVFELLICVASGLLMLYHLCLILLLIIWKKEQKQEQDETDSKEATPGNIMTLEDEKNN